MWTVLRMKTDTRTLYAHAVCCYGVYTSEAGAMLAIAKLLEKTGYPAGTTFEPIEITEASSDD